MISRPVALRLPGLQTYLTHFPSGGTALTGPTNVPHPHPARWRCAYRAYKHTSPASRPVALRLPGRQTYLTHFPPGGAALTGPTNIPHPLPPGGAALTGPTNVPHPHPARRRCAYRADKRTLPTSRPLALRLPGRQTYLTRIPPAGTALTGPTRGTGSVGRIRRSRHPAYYRRSPAPISAISPAQSTGYNPCRTSRWNVEYGQSCTRPTSLCFTGLI